jgi:hypothetical protein
MEFQIYWAGSASILGRRGDLLLQISNCPGPQVGKFVFWEEPAGMSSVVSMPGSTEWHFLGRSEWREESRALRMCGEGTGCQSGSSAPEAGGVTHAPEGNGGFLFFRRGLGRGGSGSSVSMSCAYDMEEDHIGTPEFPRAEMDLCRAPQLPQEGGAVSIPFFSLNAGPERGRALPKSSPCWRTRSPGRLLFYSHSAL